MINPLTRFAFNEITLVCFKKLHLRTYVNVLIFLRLFFVFKNS